MKSVRPEQELTNKVPDAGEERPQAWEEIEDGRYQPRRVRGSCIGRELG
jgi:hypothetical protein